MRWRRPVLLALAVCAFGFAAAGRAADADPVVDPYPLRPPDTSSPRDTLTGFLTSVDLVIAQWRAGALDSRGYRNMQNALETMDFSGTSGGEALLVQVEKMLLLKELLDRIELPPADAIPGDREVADGNVVRWTVPQTRFTIERIADGPRAGEFLFAAITVERLEQFYRMAKDLPYKPTATTPGIYAAFTATTANSATERLRERLREADASSPRATLVEFLGSIDRLYALVREADDKLKAQPPQLTDQEVRRVEENAAGLLRRATDLLDLSEVPAANRRTVGQSVAFQLKEIIDRTLLPPLEAVPDARSVNAARGRGAVPSAGGAYRWRYPNSEIEIVEMTEGGRRGQFLFSAETVRRAPEFFENVRDLPYRSELSSANRSKFFWIGESPGLYDYFISTPGYLVPQAHWLGRLVDRLPVGFKSIYFEQTLWQWLALVASVLATCAIGMLAFRVLGRLAGGSRPLLRSWLRVAAPVAAALAVQVMLDFVAVDVHITGAMERVVVAVGEASVAALAVWALLRLARALAETLVSATAIREGSHDASLVRIGLRIAAFVGGSLIVVYSLRDLGADMIPLLAGLGVGGLAVALAAQRTFANFIGSLILFANKPVRVGDFCRYGDEVGTVEHIGLLATRIRSLERSVVTVPNAEFSETKIDNFAMRDQRLLKTVLKLRYETSAEQIRYILARLRQLLLGHPKVTPSPARVRLVGYGDFSKDLEVFAYLDCADHDVFLAIQEDILLRMEDIVIEAGSGFAFPSQTAYLTRDKGLDADRQRAAEGRVDRWRRGGRLPFPEFPAEERQRLENSLDYPPRGSPEFVGRRAVADRDARGNLLSTDDLADLPAVALRLRGRLPFAEYLRGRFTEETLRLLSDYDGGRDEQLKEALVRELNEIIGGASIYDEARFGDVDLDPQTREMVSSFAAGGDAASLNRRLLDQALPKALKIAAESG